MIATSGIADDHRVLTARRERDRQPLLANPPLFCAKEERAGVFVVGPDHLRTWRAQDAHTSSWPTGCKSSHRV
jgi:hypothetical protein